MRWLEVHRHWLTKIGGGSAGPVTGGEAEGARGELVLFHQGGGVLVHTHGNHGVGVAQPLGDGADGARLADGVRESLLDPVGLVEQPLQRTELVLLLLGAVAELADQQGPAGGKGRGDVHAQVHGTDGRVAFEHDRLRGVFQQPGGVEVVGGQIARREGEQPGRARADSPVAAQLRVSRWAGLPRPAQGGVASAAHGKHPVPAAGHQPLDEGRLAPAPAARPHR